MIDYLNIVKDDNVVNVVGKCKDCDNKSSCSFIMDIRSFVRERRSFDFIKEATISIFACKKYERGETNNNICPYCYDPYV